MEGGPKRKVRQLVSSSALFSLSGPMAEHARKMHGLGFMRRTLCVGLMRDEGELFGKVSIRVYIGAYLLIERFLLRQCGLKG